MAKKKSKELLLAEMAFRDGVTVGLASVGADQEQIDEMVEPGASFSLKKWKEQTCGKRKPQIDDIEQAHKAWTAAGKPDNGLWFEGYLYKFKPDGTFDLPKSGMFASDED
jgi:hypothetical protein